MHTIRKRIFKKHGWNTDPSQKQAFIEWIMLLVFGYIVFIWGPALIVSEMEDWSITDSAYFTFVTVSTIGLGDFVPGDIIFLTL